MYDGMKSMAKTPMQAEQAGKPSDEAVYPYSLSITLTDDELEKLGLDCSDPECQVGCYLHINALAEVVGIHKVDTGQGEKKTLSLQITHMECCEEGEGEEQSGRAMPY